jgi:CheY-like chemotaxis protein
VFGITANALPEDMDEFRVAGCNEVLTKPLNFEKFKLLLDKYGIQAANAQQAQAEVTKNKDIKSTGGGASNKSSPGTPRPKDDMLDFPTSLPASGSKNKRSLVTTLEEDPSDLGTPPEFISKPATSTSSSTTTSSTAPPSSSSSSSSSSSLPPNSNQSTSSSTINHSNNASGGTSSYSNTSSTSTSSKPLPSSTTTTTPAVTRNRSIKSSISPSPPSEDNNSNIIPAISGAPINLLTSPSPRFVSNNEFSSVDFPTSNSPSFSLKKSLASPSSTTAGSGAGATTSAGGGDKLFCLVVDDVKLNRRMIKKCAELLGFICDEAEDGLQAVNACAKKHYDFILMDNVMPNMTGIEATEKIRSSQSKKNVIFGLTGTTTQEDLDKLKVAGCDEVLTKPLNFEFFKKLKNKYPELRGGAVLEE